MKRSQVGKAGTVTAVVALVAALTATAATSDRAAGPTRGGNLVIDRREDSQSFDLTSVFQNESIWPGEQIMEPLYVNSPDGKGLRPWLATSYTASKGGTVYTFHLRRGVRFSNGRPMTSADVKFSIDRSRAATKGWGYIDQAIKSVTASDPHTVVIHLKYRWAAFLSDISTFSNGIVPKRNRYYWQKGKPYLDSVTFNFVSDDNTRQLQLLGGKAQIDEFPPFNSVSKLQNAPGVTLKLFPSTRTDYLLMNEHYAPLADVHVRRAISYALDRAGIVKAVLFGNAKPANSFLPPGLPCYDPSTPGARYDISKAKAELAKSKFPHGFKLEMTVASGDQVHQAIGQILQNAVKPIGIDLTFKQVDSTTEYANIQQLKYQIGISYWQNDNIDPDELATFALDPRGGAHSWFTGYNDPKVTALVHKAHTKPNRPRAAGSTPRCKTSPLRTPSPGSSTTPRSRTPTRTRFTASSSRHSATSTSRTSGSGNAVAPFAQPAVPAANTTHTARVAPWTRRPVPCA